MGFRQARTFVHGHIIAWPRFEPRELVDDQRDIVRPDIAHLQIIDPVVHRRGHYIAKAEVLLRQPRPVFQRALHPPAGQLHMVNAFLHGTRPKTILRHLEVEMLSQRVRTGLLIGKRFVGQPVEARQERLVE
jgi:hypothetical protein